jgi:phosphoglycerate dehydrogenase-like enzyme
MRVVAEKPIRLVVDSGSASFVDGVKAAPGAERFDFITYVGKGEAALADIVADADAIYIYQHALTAPLIESARSLRFIQKHGLNCKNIDLDAARARGVLVATMNLVRNMTVAEQAIALMFACSRKIVLADKAVRDAVYRDSGIEPIRTAQREIRGNWAKIEGLNELAGTSVGIIGLGDIGMEVARRCRALGMTVHYHQRQPHTEAVEKVFEATYLPFETLLETVDYLVLVLPHTPESEGMIDAKALARMKPTATIINVSRGAIIDEDALVDVLTKGKLGMAGLDVFRMEPLPATSPLIGLQNVVLTPHIGGGSRRSKAIDRSAGLANILRFFDTGRPQGMVPSL